MVGPMFQHSTSSGSENVTVLDSGVYRVSYGLSVQQAGTGRYQILSNVNVDDISSKKCFDSGYNRGNSGSQDTVTAGECLLELTAGQNVSVAAQKVANNAGQTPSLTPTGDSWFHIQKMHCFPLLQHPS